MKETTLAACVLTALTMTTACGDSLATQAYRGDPLLVLTGTLSRALEEPRHDVAALFFSVHCDTPECSVGSVQTHLVVGDTSDGFPQNFSIAFAGKPARDALTSAAGEDENPDGINELEPREALGLLVSGTPEALAQIPAEFAIGAPFQAPDGVSVQGIEVVYRENCSNHTNGYSVKDDRPNGPLIRQAACIIELGVALQNDPPEGLLAAAAACVEAHQTSISCNDQCRTTAADVDECAQECPQAFELVSPCITDVCGDRQVTSSLDCEGNAREEILGAACPYPAGTQPVAAEEQPVVALELLRADDLNDVADLLVSHVLESTNIIDAP